MHFYLLSFRSDRVLLIFFSFFFFVYFHRLAGAALLAPVANYWWDGFPSNLSKEAYNQQLPQDKWAVGVAHYAPWLTYWWNTRKWFPGSSVIAVRFDIFSDEDKKILPKLAARGPYMVRSCNLLLHVIFFLSVPNLMDKYLGKKHW